MESVKMDTYEIHSLSLEVFFHLIFARYYQPSIGVIGKALEHYNSILTAPKQRLLDMIVFERQNIVRNYNAAVSGVTPTIYFSDIMWEYVYTLAYYLNHNSSLWKTHLLPRMKELTRVAAIKDDLKKAEELVNKYIERRMEFERDLNNDTPQPDNSAEIDQLKQQIAELQQQLADKEAEIVELKKPKALRMSFIETNGKDEQNIRWAYEDIFKAIGSPASMAECLCYLQTLGMLRGQQRTGKIKNIKGLFNEMQEAYGFTWTYDALAHAIKKLKS